MATAVVKILQIAPEASSSSLKEDPFSRSRFNTVRELIASKTGSVTAVHLPPIMNPSPAAALAGWVTEDEELWSDSPTKQPFLLYRYRFSWGRDERELFPKDGRDALSEGDAGARLGKLDDRSGVLEYERESPLSASATVRQFRFETKGSVSEKIFSVNNKSAFLREIAGAKGTAMLKEFPFILLAVPEPFSDKNPVDTDVFIRLGNFVSPISSGTITLFLDDVEQEHLQIDEFFGGLGGFNITWFNDQLFNYDARVDVRWQFRDTAIPANRTVIQYPFFTVRDLAGPRVSHLIPSDLGVNVPVLGTIQFDLEDFENDVDIESMQLFVNNTLVVNGETGIVELIRFQNKKGYTVRFTPFEPFLYGDLIPVAIFVRDTAATQNLTFFTYSFTTTESTPPRLINIKPAPCTIAVPIGTNISVDVIDGGHGLDKDSIVFTVEDIERTGQIALIPIIHRDQ